MKNFFFLFLILFCFSSYSQDVLFLKNGEEINGSVLNINKKKVYFEDANTGKRKWHKKIDKLIDDTNGVKVEFKLRDIDGLASYLSGEIIEGKVSYYIIYKHVPNAGYWQFGYIHRKGDKKALKDARNSLTTPFYKRMANYFSDCNSLAVKIKNKEFEIGDTLSIVKYYNSNCLKKQ